jgi:hypothetical protein
MELPLLPVSALEDDLGWAEQEPKNSPGRRAKLDRHIPRGWLFDPRGFEVERATSASRQSGFAVSGPAALTNISKHLADFGPGRVRVP